MQRLKCWFNPEASKVIKGTISGRESMLEGVDVAFFLEDNSGEPKKFHEGSSGQDWWHVGTAKCLA
jgi:hypothetical protein